MTNPINTSGLNIKTIYSGTKLSIFAVIASWAPSNNSFNNPEKNLEAQQLSLQHEILKKKKKKSFSSTVKNVEAQQLTLHMTY